MRAAARSGNAPERRSPRPIDSISDFAIGPRPRARASAFASNPEGVTGDAVLQDATAAAISSLAAWIHPAWRLLGPPAGTASRNRRAGTASPRAAKMRARKIAASAAWDELGETS